MSMLDLFSGFVSSLWRNWAILLGSLSLGPLKLWHQDLAGEPWRRYRKNKNSLSRRRGPSKKLVSWTEESKLVSFKDLTIDESWKQHCYWHLLLWFVGIIYCKFVWLDPLQDTLHRWPLRLTSGFVLERIPLVFQFKWPGSSRTTNRNHICSWLSVISQTPRHHHLESWQVPLALHDRNSCLGSWVSATAQQWEHAALNPCGKS